jgi:hypothetical protein
MPSDGRQQFDTVNMIWTSLDSVPHTLYPAPLCLLSACLAYSSTLKMEEVCSSETSVNFYNKIWRQIQVIFTETAVKISKLT